jgi:hypothetical protein
MTPHSVRAAFCAFLCFLWQSSAAELPAAEDLLRGCIGALPDVPLLVKGELVSRAPGGDVERKLNVEMTLDWRASPSTARYTTRDAFGHGLEHLSITWNPGQPPEYRFFTGEPLQAAPLPELSDPIGGTDISWQDLSLSFLWWPGGKTVGAEEIRSRACYVVELPASHIAVRLCIDPQIPVMLRAETWEPAAGAGKMELRRRMDVKGFKKINDRWVIHDVEVQSFPSRHKTSLRVRDVQDRTRKDFIKVDDAGGEDVEPVQAIGE